jgi:predicted kinase
MPSGNESTPPILLLSGLPGAGKTTFAHRLAALAEVHHIESDAVRREIFPRPAYTFAERDAFKMLPYGKKYNKE